MALYDYFTVIVELSDLVILFQMTIVAGKVEPSKIFMTSLNSEAQLTTRIRRFCSFRIFSVHLYEKLLYKTGV